MIRKQLVIQVVVELPSWIIMLIVIIKNEKVLLMMVLIMIMIMIVINIVHQLGVQHHQRKALILFLLLLSLPVVIQWYGCYYIADSTVDTEYDYN